MKKILVAVAILFLSSDEALAQGTVSVELFTAISCRLTLSGTPPDASGG